MNEKYNSHAVGELKSYQTKASVEYSHDYATVLDITKA